MNGKKRLFKSICYLLMLVLCVTVITACFDDECSHRWNNWTVATEATCVEPGTKVRKCSKCEHTDISVIEKLGHEWIEASCLAPKTCNRCSTVEGEKTEHGYNQEVVKEEALKSAATCANAAIYYKSCTCGMISTSNEDTFTSGEPLPHTYNQEVVKEEALKSVATCTNVAVYYKSCTCGAISTSDEDTFTSGDVLPHTYNQEVANEETFKTAATCTNAAVYYKSCICGVISMKDEDTFTSGDLLPHTYDQEVISDESLKSNATCANAAVYYKSCICGVISANDEDTFTSGEPLPHTYDQEVVKEEALKSAATCTNAAVYYKSCICGVISTSDDNTFTNGNPLPHTYDHEVVKEEALKSAVTCTSAALYYKSCICGVISTNDEYTFTSGTATGHLYVVISTTLATCHSPATTTYKCSCDDQYSENVGDALGHNISGVTPREVHVQDCEYILVYACKNDACQEEVEGNQVFHHTYVATITKAATCQADGEKTLTCTCGDTKTEVIAMNETGHIWDKGTVENNVRIDTCLLCNETKNVTVYEGNTTNLTNTNDLINTEIELSNANIILDAGVIETLGDKNVQITADKLADEDRLNLGLSEEKLAQVGDNPIYNFTINDGTSNIAQFGENNWVTITLPYVLADGEDVDSIAVWFINENGELESIRATYNNGYVTFKTNHFSYYTVTRLTPAERCATYGHSYLSYDELGSCTKDSYTLYVCLRCHESHKENIVLADGHDYVANTYVATCTENGYTTYSCSDCNHSYTIKLNATGHSWNNQENVASTCAENGYIKYVCSSCNNEYTETYEKLAHEIKTTVINEDCEKAGYHLYECNNCDYSYTDNYVAAHGHRYEISTWNWNDDYTSSTLSLICVNDEAHTLLLNANVGITVFYDLCSDYVKTTYTAAISYYGVTIKDVKIVESGTRGHNFSSEWENDSNVHWHECICGEKTDESEHIFENEEITKNPTCMENGEKISYCTCGKTNVTIISSTREHVYVDGYCVMCGKEVSQCDHTQLHQESFNLSEYEGCKSIFRYYTCDCGEVVDFGTETPDFDCMLEMREENQTVDENGNIYASMEAYCTECGMEVYATAVGIQEGCKGTALYSFTFVKDGLTLIANGTYGAENYSHQTISKIINLPNTDTCGGTIELRKCSLCNIVLSITRYDLNCNVDLINMPEAEEVIDDNGVVHYVYRIKCSDCGLEIIFERWSSAISICEGTSYQLIFVNCGEETIVECYEEGDYNNHQYEKTYELQGNTCNDGLLETKHCILCDEYSSDYSYGHPSEAYKIDLTDYNGCGGVISGSRCTVCTQSNYIDMINLECQIDIQLEPEVVVDENGITRYLLSTACPNCGLVFATETWTVAETPCIVTSYRNEKIYSEGSLIFEYTYTSREQSHEYEYSYVLNDDSCYNGGTITTQCLKCGETTQQDIRHHNYEYITVNLRDFNCCYGVLSGEYCTICGDSKPVDEWYECEFDKEVDVTEVVDENGIMHYLTTKTCIICEMKVEEERWTINKSTCVTNEYISTKVYSNESLLFDFTYKNIIYKHDYQYSYEFAGETCTDGVNIIGHCSICGDKSEQYSYRHKDERFDINLGEFNGCDGSVRGTRCSTCGKILYLYIEYLACDSSGQSVIEEIIDENGITHYITIEGCSKCSIKFITERWTTFDSACIYIEHEVLKIYSGTDLIIDYSSTKRGNTHTYEYTYQFDGATCNDGVQVTTSCTICGDTYSDYMYGHQSNPIDIELSDLGGCWGWISGSQCTICEKWDYVNDNIQCEIVEQSVPEEVVDENGTTHYISSGTCSICGLIYIVERWTVQESSCISLEYHNVQIYSGTDLIIDYSSTESVNAHNYEYTYQFDGTTCDDGVRVTTFCTICGDTYSDYLYGHQTNPIDIELSEFGGCWGWISGSQCTVCDKWNYVNDNIVCEIVEQSVPKEVVDENGITHYISSGTCSECGLIYIVERWTVQESSCISLEYHDVQIYSGTDLIIDYSSTESVNAHNYEYTYQFDGATCNDGVQVIASCTICDDSYSDYLYSHQYNSIYIELSEFGDCWGRISGSQCTVCDKWNYVNDNIQCEIVEQSVPEEVVDENGTTHYISSGTCSECGLIYIVERWTVQESSCISLEYRKVQIYSGVNLIIDYATSDTNLSHEYIYDFTLNGTSCEDGFTVAITCEKCNTSDIKNHNYHQTYMIFELGDIDGCCDDHQFKIESCPCGQSNYINCYISDRVYTSNEYYDEQGRLISVEIQTCRQCALQYSLSYYTIKDVENCVSTEYYTVSLSFAETLITTHQYSIVKEVHDYTITSTLIGGIGSSCEDGFIVTHTCKNCNVSYTQELNYHAKYTFFALGDIEGCCDGHRFRIESCPCGLHNNIFCYISDRVYTGNEYYDEQGRLISVEIQTCRQCALQYSLSYYTINDVDNCTATTYYTVILSFEEKLITTYQYSRVQEVHDYITTSSLVGGIGSSCEDGAIVTHTCKICGHVETESITYHKMYESEIIELSKYGSVCGGYAVVEKCVCNKNVRVNLDHVLCELSRHWIESWIVDGIRDSQYTTMGSQSFTGSGVHYTCAVTSPEDRACTCAIRYATYWLKEADTCQAYQYLTWQFGYNEGTETCLYEITFKTTQRTYHNYVANDIGNGTEYICSDCGSSYKYLEYYNSSNKLIKEELIAINTLSNGENKQHESVTEYVFEDEYSFYTSRDYTRTISANDEEYWHQTLITKEPYSGDFGDSGYETTRIETDSNGLNTTNKEAYVVFKGYTFAIYTMQSYSDSWDRSDYTYTFEKCCTKTTTYSNSNGDTSTSTTENCIFTYTIIRDATCTQDGIEEAICAFCNCQNIQTSLSARDHRWVLDSDGLYRCLRCNLENTNGVSGEVIMEDLTQKYGNNENYVVGYLNRSDVAFTHYVSLILNDGTEYVLTDITFIEIEGLRVIAFNKNDVETLATAAGYTDATQYDVRLSIVPIGSDGSFDYAITFTE